ncbi:MAG: DKNYY domain-containing protein [Deltaproteobacteria bacterium]|nr:DKNYY domain-containing protein [Deltaproteobacteria bacterium]
MQIQLKTNKREYQFNEPIYCTLNHQDGSPLEGADHFGYRGFIINGKTVYYSERQWGAGPIKFEQSLWDYWESIGENCKIKFQLEVRLGNYPNILTFFSQVEELSIDLKNIHVIRTPRGSQSCYIRQGRNIYYISQASRGTEKSYRKTAADFEIAQALEDFNESPSYLSDANYVFRNGVLLKGVNPKEFKVFNRIFAGDGKTVFTPYGNAKVLHPEYFEVLDDGDRYINKGLNDLPGCRAGYGRDDLHVYWFSGDSMTKHASIVRSCKKTASFVSIEYGYGKDDDFVYFEGKRVKGADPKSWAMLNRYYSSDNQSVYYFTEKVPDADSNTFEVIPEIGEGYLPDSNFGRDRSHVFEGCRIVDPEKLKKR